MSKLKYEVLATGRTAEMLAWKEGWVLKLFFDWFPEDGVSCATGICIRQMRS